MTAAGRRRALVVAAAIVVVLSGGVLLARALRYEPPRRVWVGHRVEPGGAERVLDGLFDAPGGREISGAFADGSDRSLLVWFGELPRDGRIAGSLRRALGLAPRSWSYRASADAVTLGDTRWFPYDRDDVRPGGRD